MKLSSLIASIMMVADTNAQSTSSNNNLTVADWNICVQDSDCKTTGYKCCEAYKLGFASANVCGGSQYSTIPSTGGVYAGFSFKCFTGGSRDRWATC